MRSDCSSFAVYQDRAERSIGPTSPCYVFGAPVPWQFTFRDRTASMVTICCTTAMPESLCWMGGIVSMHEEEDAVD